MGHDGDVDEILAHPFFSGLDLELLKSMSLPAPFIPTVPDLEKVKDNANVVLFKDMKETEVPLAKQK